MSADVVSLTPRISARNRHIEVLRRAGSNCTALAELLADARAIGRLPASDARVVAFVTDGMLQSVREYIAGLE